MSSLQCILRILIAATFLISNSLCVPYAFPSLAVPDGNSNGTDFNGCTDAVYSQRPCVCGGKLGLRLHPIMQLCRQRGQAVTYQNAAPDATVHLTNHFSETGLSCVTYHLVISRLSMSPHPMTLNHSNVELGWIANMVNNGDESICTAFQSSTGGASAAFTTFFNKINSVDNLVFVPVEVDQAKAHSLNGDLNEVDKRTGQGTINYFDLLASGVAPNPRQSFAQDIGTTLGTLVPGEGTDWSERWGASVDSAKRTIHNVINPSEQKTNRFSMRPFIQAIIGMTG